jgi:putative colanic acid biosynthesis acetyltransferase WcaF
MNASGDNPMCIQDGRGQPNPYSRGERLRRCAWVLVQALIYRPVPRVFNRWHVWLLRMFGAEIGEGTVVYPTAEIHFPWLLRTGNHCVIGDRAKIYNLGPVEIGRHSVISQHAHLCAGTHDHTDPTLPLVRANIRVGEGCWICADAFLGPGVSVGNHSVVGARSVVTGNLPDGMVCAGNPCRPIKARVMRRKS